MQTMLDKSVFSFVFYLIINRLMNLFSRPRNPRLLARLPPPLASLASYQLLGRGRGSTIWLSPFSLAVAEACREEAVLGPTGSGTSVRLKWPNDIYVVVDEDKKKKIGGVLVNTSFGKGTVDLVVGEAFFFLLSFFNLLSPLLSKGCGLNVLNEEPIFSLAQLLPPEYRHSTLSLERTLATILVQFGKMWKVFVEQRGSFEPFMDLYLERWLH